MRLVIRLIFAPSASRSRNACTTSSGPIALTAIWRRKPSKPSNDSSESRSRMPAFGTRMSMRVSARRLASAATAASSVTSMPASTCAPVASSASLDLRQTAMTRSPRAANCRVSARPMPRFAPVIRMVAMGAEGPPGIVNAMSVAIDGADEALAAGRQARTLEHVARCKMFVVEGDGEIRRCRPRGGQAHQPADLVPRHALRARIGAHATGIHRVALFQPACIAVLEHHAPLLRGRERQARRDHQQVAEAEELRLAQVAGAGVQLVEVAQRAGAVSAAAGGDVDVRGQARLPSRRRQIDALHGEQPPGIDGLRIAIAAGLVRHRPIDADPVVLAPQARAERVALVETAQATAAEAGLFGMQPERIEVGLRPIPLRHDPACIEAAQALAVGHLFVVEATAPQLRQAKVVSAQAPAIAVHVHAHAIPGAVQRRAVADAEQLLRPVREFLAPDHRADERAARMAAHVDKELLQRTDVLEAGGRHLAIAPHLAAADFAVCAHVLVEAQVRAEDAAQQALVEVVAWRELRVVVVDRSAGATRR